VTAISDPPYPRREDSPAPGALAPGLEGSRTHAGLGTTVAVDLGRGLVHSITWPERVVGSGSSGPRGRRLIEGPTAPPVRIDMAVLPAAFPIRFVAGRAWG
jgi:hypothetical protein